MVLLEISLQYRVIIGISAMVLLFGSFIIVFIANQRKKLQYHKKLQAINEEQQKTLVQQNVLLEQRVKERTAQITQQKETLQSTLTELKASQLQLIQKEKMASLGELTAGIAHEIQNPLNFVNNFAEINAELLTEIKERLAEETLPPSLTKYIDPIIADLGNNLEKIHQHGKRADGIVKNMLQHSQTHTGAMELTNLNALVEEYVKLAFYGFRAKNKNFNCTLTISFDNNVENILIIPQDIGRILINLCNNAFYSMQEKTQMVTVKENFEPVLIIKTYKKEDTAVIIIRDNGMGIAQKYIDKIFQPFFTTKPTGNSTGLGLSLSYDIIKAHQGNLKATAAEGEFAEFCVTLSY